MQDSKGEGIEEVFIVQTEAVDFLATLVRLSEGRVLANGRVLFQDGSRWILESPEGERSAMRQEIMKLAETFASQYGTEVFQLRFKEAMGFDKFIQHLREAKPERWIC
jgi:hypothetical protein